MTNARRLMLGLGTMAFALAVLGAQEKPKDGGAAPAGAASGPAAGAENDLGKMQVRTLAPIRYVHLTAKTRFEGGQLGKDIERLVNQVVAEARQGKLPAFRGSLIFQYEGVGPGKEFTLQVGYDVPAGVPVAAEKLPEGFEFKEEPEFKAATALYTGEPAGIGQSWGELMQEANGALLEPGGVGREYYLYWEGPQSKNNVVMLAMGLK